MQYSFATIVTNRRILLDITDLVNEVYLVNYFKMRMMFTYPELSPNAEVNFATRIMARIPVKIFGKRIKELSGLTKIC